MVSKSKVKLEIEKILHGHRVRSMYPEMLKNDLLDLFVKYYDKDEKKQQDSKRMENPKLKLG
jgi:tRNA nucleotidyltransferase/poly(A) polymerase